MSNVQNSFSGGYSVILVLFILLVIVGAIYLGSSYC